MDSCTTYSFTLASRRSTHPILASSASSAPRERVSKRQSWDTLRRWFKRLPLNWQAKPANRSKTDFKCFYYREDCPRRSSSFAETMRRYAEDGFTPLLSQDMSYHAPDFKQALYNNRDEKYFLYHRQGRGRDRIENRESGQRYDAENPRPLNDQ